MDAFHIRTATPVIFSSIQSICNDGTIKLFWNTEPEQDNSRFVVQRSKDGVIWHVAGSVAAARQSTITKRYSFLEDGPEMVYIVLACTALMA